MKRLINDGDIFDKYANLEEKSLKDHPEEKIGNFDWYGHRHISGTYYGAAYNCSLADNYMANNLRSSSNPTGSILKEAKNYTDSKVAGISTSAVVQQANAYTDTKFTAANAYTDTKFTEANTYTNNKLTEAKSYTDTKLTEAKSYTDTKFTAANDHADAKFTEAKAYSDKKLTEAKAYSDTKLTAAKNYTDSKVKNLYYHFINLQGNSGHVYFNYISRYGVEYTIATLKNALIGKTVVCSGFLNGSVAEYIESAGGNLSVGVVDVSDGSTNGEIIDNTFSITDEVSPI